MERLKLTFFDASIFQGALKEYRGGGGLLDKKEYDAKRAEILKEL